MTDLPLNLLRSIDEQCDRFEEAWRDGLEPDLESFIQDWEAAHVDVLFRHLLEIEVDYRRQSGEACDAASYLDRYTNFATTIEDVFSAAFAVTVPEHNSTQLGPVEAARTFLPGEILTSRYRIVSLLGKGGMGEVYRAEDLRLGQTVALKFLPSEQSGDDRSVQYFLREVRVSQRLSHPNICRVHDLIETESFRCLSMEYIEGEDLRSLLRRVTLLSETKALQLAREICLGLAAAHESRVLHRDLKPANIMVDERGRARITDFGLARECHQSGEDELVGSPAYMAPEQLSHQQTSIQSDLFSLGLILLEMFAGERIHRAKTLDELRELHRNNVALSVARDATQLSPPIRDAIVACLQREPGNRPESARSLAAMLPGNRKSEALFDQEETPSPRMVAAAGPAGTLGVIGRWSLAATAGVLLVIAMFVSSMAFSRFGKIDSPDLLADRSKTVLDELGIPRGTESAWGYRADRKRQISETPRSWPKSMTGTSSSVNFWYRESLTPLAPLVPDWKGEAFLSVDEARPPLVAPGMTTLRLDGEGHLIHLEAILPSDVGPSRKIDGEPVWIQLFDLAGLSEDQVAALQPVEPSFSPVGFADQRRSWTLTERDDQGEFELRIDAAERGGIPSYFRITGPSDKKRPSRSLAGITRGNARLTVILVIWIPALLIAAVILARVNLNAKRADRDAARRLATFGACAVLLMWLLGDGHVLAPLEVDLLLTALAGATLMAAVVWTAYIAFEPFMRRLFPQSLVSWNRLLRGDFADPLIGRDVLIGIAAGSLAALGKLAIVEGPRFFGIKTVGLPNIYNLGPLIGLRPALAEFVEVLVLALIYSLFFQMLLLLSFKLVVRHTWIACVAFVAFLSTMVAVQYVPAGWAFCVTTIEMSLTALIYLRIGLLAGISMHFTRLLLKWPMSIHSSDWYAETGHLALAVLVLLIGWSVYITTPRTQNRPAGSPQLTE